MRVLREALSDSPPHVVDQLASLGWAGVEAIEHAEYLHFPDKLVRAKKNGAFEEIAVALRVPRGHELRKARALAREMCVQAGIDPEKDRDLYEDARTVCELQAAIRDPVAPFTPMFPTPDELERKFDRVALAAIFAKVDALNDLVNPRPEAMTANELLVVVAAIAKERSIRPLAVFGSGAQRSYIITTADLLLSSTGLRSSPESSAPSTPESSTSASSPA